MKLISTSSRKGQAQLAALFSRRSAGYDRAIPAAQRIICAVRRGGDATLRRYAARLDHLSQQDKLRISLGEMSEAANAIPAEFKRALQVAARNIRAFAVRQRPKDWDFAPARGVTVGQRVRPIDAVGCYVPGGRY